MANPYADATTKRGQLKRLLWGMGEEDGSRGEGHRRKGKVYDAGYKAGIDKFRDAQQWTRKRLAPIMRSPPTRP